MEQTTESICNHPSCTFSQTGVCILNNTPLTCPERLASILLLDVPDQNVIGNEVLESPEEMKRFSSSLSISTEALQVLMHKKYCKVVGILGLPGTGKTASLASLYLLLAHKKLKNFEFLDSDSIMAFEEISRGSRVWNLGKLPEVMTSRTELQDERNAGYLHLRVKQISSNSKVDLLLTDLPGEWTKALIDNNRIERLSFLSAADRIWITINSEHIQNAAMRQYTLHRLKLLIGRLTSLLKGNMCDLTIVLTHTDTPPSVIDYLKPIKDWYTDSTMEIVEIASFSANPHIKPGSGISELIEDLMCCRKKESTNFWHKQSSLLGGRKMLQFQN